MLFFNASDHLCTKSETMTCRDIGSLLFQFHATGIINTYI